MRSSFSRSRCVVAILAVKAGLEGRKRVTANVPLQAPRLEAFVGLRLPGALPNFDRLRTREILPQGKVASPAPTPFKLEYLSFDLNSLTLPWIAAKMIRTESARVPPKRRAELNYKKSQFATANYKQLDYPHRLNFYEIPPTADITLEEFEQWAIDRLKSMSHYTNSRPIVANEQQYSPN